MSLAIGLSALKSRKSMDAATEQALVEQCRRQNREAFGKVLDAYQARVLGFVRRMVQDHEEALDITQEVFVKAFQAFERFDGRCSLRSWLFRIAHNLCIDRARKRDRTPKELSLDAPMIGEEEPIGVVDARWHPENITLNAELQEVVEHAISTMSEKLRSVLMLSDREEMPYDEIAKLLDLPIGTVKSRLFLARAHLQACLNNYLHEGATR